MTMTYSHNNLVIMAIKNSGENSVVVATTFFAQSHLKNLAKKSEFFCYIIEKKLT